LGCVVPLPRVLVVPLPLLLPAVRWTVSSGDEGWTPWCGTWAQGGHRYSLEPALRGGATHLMLPPLPVGRNIRPLPDTVFCVLVCLGPVLWADRIGEMQQHQGRDQEAEGK
jgi:hypothetical protein